MRCELPSFSARDKAVFLRIMDLVRNMLGVDPIKPVEWPAGKAIMIRSGQPQALAFFRGYGFPQARATVQVRKQIVESNDKGVAKAFLCGLFSTDGCFSFQVNRGPRVEIQVKSEKLRDDFVSLVRKLGFSFRAYEYLPHRGKNKTPLQVAYTTQTKQVVRWMEEIDSIKDLHIKRCQDWKMLIERR
jgi:intein/homing endonuclease